jgi:serine-type D-Ala-D-Ala carboxypeptidase/endopeptidase (penicillin-binding protein 4)
MQTRRAMIAGILATWAAPVWAQRPKPRPMPKDDAAEMIKAAKLGGAVSYLVADPQTGAILAAHNMDMGMAPASVTKAVTALFALSRLGADHQFRTQILAVGNQRGTVFEGDLILTGGGDPTLDTDRMGDIAAALGQLGLREITGRFLYYEAALPYQDRIADDQPVHVGYNPAISGLMLNFNRANFVWKLTDGALQSEMNAEGARHNPKLRSIEVRIVARETPLFLYEGEGPKERWTVAAPSLGKGGSRWLPVRKPGRYASEVFQTLCAAQGLRLPDAVAIQVLPETAEVLTESRSAPLSAILKDMLRYSTNITAEAIGLAASGQASLRQSAQVMTEWARVTYGVTAIFGDHSGLGKGSQTTAIDLVKILSGAPKSPNGAMLIELLRSSNVTGPDGKEKRTDDIQILAKSGTLNFVSALAGYIRKSNQQTLVFAIFSADLARRAAVPISQRERPEGGTAWTKRARALQRTLIAQWVDIFL